MLNDKFFCYSHATLKPYHLAFSNGVIVNYIYYIIYKCFWVV
jgi:hypothetical protein